MLVRGTPPPTTKTWETEQAPWTKEKKKRKTIYQIPTRQRQNETKKLKERHGKKKSSRIKISATIFFLPSS